MSGMWVPFATLNVATVPPLSTHGITCNHTTWAETAETMHFNPGYVVTTGLAS